MIFKSVSSVGYTERQTDRQLSVQCSQIERKDVQYGQTDRQTDVQCWQTDRCTVQADRQTVVQCRQTERGKDRCTMQADFLDGNLAP